MLSPAFYEDSSYLKPILFPYANTQPSNWQRRHFGLNASRLSSGKVYQRSAWIFHERTPLRLFQTVFDSWVRWMVHLQSELRLPKIHLPSFGVSLPPFLHILQDAVAWTTKMRSEDSQTRRPCTDSESRLETFPRLTTFYGQVTPPLSPLLLETEPSWALTAHRDSPWSQYTPAQSPLRFGSALSFLHSTPIPSPVQSPRHDVRSPLIPASSLLLRSDFSNISQQPLVIRAPRPRHLRPTDSFLDYPSMSAVLGAENNLYDPNTRHSNTLNIEIAGKGYLNWNYIQRASVEPFLRRQAQNATLTIDWKDSKADSGGTLGRTVLKSLFRCLNQDIDIACSSTYKPIGRFKRLSISIPPLVNDMGSYNLLGNPTLEDDSVDLRYAASMKEFIWKGDFAVLIRKFRGVRWENITVLEMSGCMFSVDDAVALVLQCGFLETLSLETLEDAAMLDDGDITKSSDMPRLTLQALRSLTLKSNTSIYRLTDRIGWRRLQNLNLTLRNEGMTGITHILDRLDSFTNLHVTSRLAQQTMDELCHLYPDMIYIHEMD